MMPDIVAVLSNYGVVNPFLAKPTGFFVEGHVILPL